MSVFAHVDGLGAEVEQCVADSILAWRSEFKPGQKTVDTLAEHLTNVETTVSLRPAGVAMVTVQVKGAGFLEHSTECFRLKRAKLGEWITTASSLTQR